MVEYQGRVSGDFVSRIAPQAIIHPVPRNTAEVDVERPYNF